ncbi:MAG: hypothetical protein IJ783_03170 [Kiritimatiellae bacterium]|nr:hypothetical protein [Kiritimatiellia bacterium]
MEALRKQLQTLQKEAAAQANTLAGRWSKASAQKKFGMVAGGATGALDLASALLPASASGSRGAKALSESAAGAQKFGMMLAPLGPAGLAVGAAIGTVTGALKSLSESSREARKAAEEDARSKKAAARGGTQSLTDVLVAHELEMRGASAEERAKMQYEARGRLADAQYRLDRGASISEKDVFDALNWNGDGPLVRRLLAAHAKQNDGKLSPVMEVLRDTLRREDAEKGIAALRRKSYFQKNYETWWNASDRSDRLESQSRNDYFTPEVQRGFAAKAKAAREEADAAGRVVDAMLAPYQAILDAAPEYEAASREVRRRGKSGFDPALDALWDSMNAPKAEPELAPAAPESPLSRLLSGPAAVDSLSSVGIGYTGSGDKSAEMLELLRRIADASDRTARKDAIAILK